MSHQTVSQVARDLSERYGRTVLPRHVTELFYCRKLSDEGAPIISGRRMIAPALVQAIELELKRAGKLPRREVAARG